ncbi:ABC transporter permease [Salinigranum marinum]|uniref:ABC transporter permease n=1 Tax=Salinigranum marinum TaxID=1515595 RepID=UPI002989D707|nr:ABC transporter permease [Salinigranum marinum]
MSIREELHDGQARARWYLMDGLISVKNRLPVDTTALSDRFGYALIAPGLLLVSFLAVGMGLLVWYSFLTYDSIEIFVYQYTLANWERLLNTTAFHTVFFRTLLYSAVVTVGTVALAFPYAYLVVRTDRPIFRYVLLFGLFVPFFTGVIIRAYGWLIVLGKNGLLNWALGTVGIGPVAFIGTPVAVIVGLLQYLIPFAVLMLTPAIASIDSDLERAAKNCGANQWNTFRYVVLPLARPGITAATIVVFTLSMANYSIPDLLGGGTLGFAANFVYNKIFGTLNYPFAAVLCIVLVAIASLFVFVVFKRYGTGTLGVEVSEE